MSLVSDVPTANNETPGTILWSVYKAMSSMKPGTYHIEIAGHSASILRMGGALQEECRII